MRPDMLALMNAARSLLLNEIILEAQQVEEILYLRNKTRAYIVTHPRKERKEQYNRIKVQHDARSKDKNCKDKVRIQYALNGDRYNVLLIWLDNNINDNSVDCRKTISQLRCIVNTINTFTDGDKCIQFLDNMGNEKACMIISGSLGQ
jgi:hypothetical protein